MDEVGRMNQSLLDHVEQVKRYHKNQEFQDISKQAKFTEFEGCIMKQARMVTFDYIMRMLITNFETWTEFMK